MGPDAPQPTFTKYHIHNIMKLPYHGTKVLKFLLISPSALNSKFYHVNILSCILPYIEDRVTFTAFAKIASPNISEHSWAW